MNRLHWIVLLGLLVGITGLHGQDEVEGPWGAANGDIFGRARSADIPELFSTAVGVQEAWQFEPLVFESARAVGFSSIVFDAAGNLYWRTINGKLTSADSDGFFRWNASDGSDYLFGSSFASPVVGVERVYALGAPNGEPVVAAFSKEDGSLMWENLLPEGPWSVNEHPAPILYQGKVYIVGESDGVIRNVYQIDAATGATDWSDEVAIPINSWGTLALAPDIFASGTHGLYLNGDSGSGTDGIAEVYGIRVDSDPSTGGATLEWESEGGKTGHSHVIYNPDAPGGPRIYTHTWTDYGGELYSFDPVAGSRVVNQNMNDSGHGFYDVGCLDFDDTALVCGGFNGEVVVYTDDGTGATTDDIFQFSNGQTPSNWFGEYRTFGQLLQSPDGDSLLVSGTNSRVADFGADFTARAVILDVSNAMSSTEDGPLYIDDIEVLEGPDLGSLTPVFSEDFESLARGDLPPQEGWEDDREAPSGNAGPVQVIDDPTGSGQGQVAAFDAQGNDSGWQGVFHDFPDTTGDVVVVRYRQYRFDRTDNLWAYFGDAPNDFDSEPWAIAWDLSQSYHPHHFDGAAVPQTVGIWQTVTFTYDNLNDPDPANRTATVDVDGTSSTTDLAANPAERIYGFGIQLEGTPPTTPGTPNTPLVEYDTGIQADHFITLRAGPLVGPDGKLYYFDNETDLLIAVEGVQTPEDEFRRGDSDANGVFNGLPDGLLLLSFQFVPGSPAPPCMDAADADDDGQFNGLTDGLLVLNFQFVPGSPPPPAPGPAVCGVDPTDDALDCVMYDACP